MVMGWLLTDGERRDMVGRRCDDDDDDCQLDRRLLPDLKGFCCC